jgi:fructose-bisphosphate aldolase, class I
MKINLNGILNNGKTLFLAYDQGLEHGPIDFNDKNVDPKLIIEIAKKGKYNAVIFQKGIAEKYLSEIRKNNIKLVVKLNGKTSLGGGEPVSRQICSVKEAIELGAVAVGYTIYIGSEYESEMMQEFALIEEEAHKKGIPIIAWIYPSGKNLEGKDKNELMEYAARVGLEIGADIVKIKYSGDKDSLSRAVKLAGKTKVVVAGGVKEGEKEFLESVADFMKAGAIGLAVGRNIWQNENPLEISSKIRKIVFNK